MRHALVVLLFMLHSYVCFSQDYFMLGANCVEKNQYLKAVDTLQKLLDRQYKLHPLQKSKPNTSNLDQALSLYKSFIGEEYVINWPERKQINSKITEGLIFTDAVSYIAKQAMRNQVIMINEDHNTPKHRLLTYNLLDTLYRLGYRYLAVEALVPNCRLSVNLKYPSTYLPEPNMANLIKKAIKMGYKLVAYESEDETDYNPANANYADNLREQQQARNLYQILLEHPHAKVLVHTGPGHIWKQADDGLVMMAQRFKTISGINPLTINQSVNNLNEFTPQLDTALRFKRNNAPYVVLNSKGKAQLSVYDKRGSYDLLVAWPSSNMIAGRKSFSLNKRGSKKYMISVHNNDTGNLVQIKSSALKDEIPVDQFVIKSGIKQYATALDVDKYILQVVDKKGNIIWQRRIVIR